jgi:hypothetical protein
MGLNKDIQLIIVVKLRSNKMKVLNLTPFQTTSSQFIAGVVDLPESERVKLIKLLSFNAVPSQKELIERSEAIAEIARKTGCDTAMIGGVPYILAILEQSLNSVGINPVYSFTIREIKQVCSDISTQATNTNSNVRFINEDASTQMIETYRHVGFVMAVQKNITN